ncbi:MAG TPA: sensor histidine kinase [Thermoanaerobaculia bacterium]|nr:sensor histidine kinase [Thermoanaerobaculia bacterium]
MILLRLFIVANTAVLALVGLAIAFSPTAPLPVRYSAGEPYQSLALVHLLAMALAASAIVLLLQSRLSLIRELRRFGLGLSLANGLISLMALMEQFAFGGSSVGWALVLLPFSAASALAAMALRPPQPADIAAEIESLKIPDEIRQGLLRQIGEAAAQEERNRLARDLHDSIKQQLFSINVGTAAAQERWERDPEGARKALADVRRSAREAMVEMQAMLHQLRPEALGTAGLIEALREQCEALGYRTGAEVSFELGEPVPDELMPPGAPEALFRIGQEMLANVARHARARKVRVWLGRQDQDVMLRVLDDGQGFDPAAEVSGMGLRNLKERAASLRGRLEVATSPGSGAELTVRIPLVSPPVSVPVNPRRLVLSEFFIMIVMGTIFIPASGKLENGYWVGGAFVLSTCCLLSWILGRSSPRSFQKLMNLKGGILTTLYIAWWVFGFLPVEANFKESALWGLLPAICLYVVFVLAWLHRASDARRLWQKGHRFWLLLVLPVEAGILLALRSAIAKPRPLVLNVLEAICLLAMAVGFAYAASRQPRTEGATR